MTSDRALDLDAVGKSKAGLFRWQPLCVGCAVFVTLFVLFPRFMLTDADTLWHIDFGRQIIETWSVPTQDRWSYTAFGQPWIAKEWLSQVLLAVAYRAAGWNGVVGMAAFAAGLAFAQFSSEVGRRMGGVFAVFAVVALLVLTWQHLLARPHVLAFPVMVAWFAGLSRALDEGRAPRLALAFVMLVWANMHGGFTLGLLYAPLFAAAALWNSWGEKSQQRRVLAIGWARFVVLSALAACVTPYGPGSMLITVKLLGLGDALSLINEWKAPDFQQNKAILAVVLAWVGLGLVTGPRQPLPRILLIIPLLVLFFTAGRNAELLGFLLPLFIAPRRGPAPRRGGDVRGWAEPVLVAAIAAIAATATVAAAASGRLDLAPPSLFTPRACLEAALADGMGGRKVLNSYEFGGFLITQRVPTFIDGRAELFGGDALIEYNNLQLLRGPDPLAPLALRGVEWTLMNPVAPLVRALDLLPGWERLHTEPTCVVHVRRG